MVLSWSKVYAYLHIRKTFGVFITVLCVTNCVFSQTNKDLERADAYYSIGQFKNAINYYERGIRKHNTSYVNEKLAKCYRKLGRPDLSVHYLKKIKVNFARKPDLQFDLCQNLKMTGDFEGARNVGINLLFRYPDNKSYKSLVASCDSAEEWSNTRDSKFAIQKVQGINTPYSEISAYPIKNELYFASNREGLVIKDRPNEGEMPFYDLYRTKIDSMGKAGKVNQFKAANISDAHESSVSFDSTMSKIFFTRHIEKDDSIETHARLKIFYLENAGGKWKNPHSFVYNDSTSSFAHPFLTQDETMFFFVSDMKGGVGGSDIYFCVLKDSLWSIPVNMGEPVNTPGNEIFPVYDQVSKKLYFASDHHIGMGGYDIFEATEHNGSFMVTNLHPPVNSTYDDFGLIFNVSNPKTGYFVSNRPGGKGLEDIYRVVMK